MENQTTAIAENVIMESEKDLNSKILKITMTIKEKYPELSKYIEEMEETIPNEETPEITLRNLKAYFESLNSMVNRYVNNGHQMK